MSNTPDWALVNADDLLYEWTQIAKERVGWRQGGMGWSRELSPVEANVILGALYDAREELAYRARCDALSPDGSLRCDFQPGHEGRHANVEGSEWRETRYSESHSDFTDSAGDPRPRLYP